MSFSPSRSSFADEPLRPRRRSSSPPTAQGRALERQLRRGCQVDTVLSGPLSTGPSL